MSLQQSFSRLRKSFAQLSLEKKLTIFFVPILAALAGTLIPRFLSGGGGEPPGFTAVIQQSTAARSENLEVDKLVAVNSLDRYASAEIRVLVRNTGDVDSLIHSAEVRVTEYERRLSSVFRRKASWRSAAPTSWCSRLLGGGGKTFDVDLQQQIPCGQAGHLQLQRSPKRRVRPGQRRLAALRPRRAA